MYSLYVEYIDVNMYIERSRGTVLSVLIFMRLLEAWCREFCPWLSRCACTRRDAAVQGCNLCGGIISVPGRTVMPVLVFSHQSQVGGIHAYTCIYICVYVKRCVYTYICLHRDIYMQIHVQIHIHIHIPVHIYIHAYIHTYIHTCIHTFMSL